jgi:ABC-type lipoprotein export system ATPase subunit
MLHLAREVRHIQQLAGKGSEQLEQVRHIRCALDVGEHRDIAGKQGVGKRTKPQPSLSRVGS